MAPSFRPRSNPGRCQGRKPSSPPINLAGQRLGVFARRDRDDCVGVNVIDMRVGNEAVQRRVDRGRARIEIERAMIVERDHLVLVREAAIDRSEAEELVEVERREAVELHRADIAARTFDPKDFRRRAGQRIGGGQLRRSVAAAKIGDAKIAAEQIGPIEQQTGLIEGSRVRVVPKIGQRSVKARGDRRPWVVPLDAMRFSSSNMQMIEAASTILRDLCSCSERI